MKHAKAGIVFRAGDSFYESAGVRVTDQHIFRIQYRRRRNDHVAGRWFDASSRRLGRPAFGVLALVGTNARLSAFAAVSTLMNPRTVDERFGPRPVGTCSKRPAGHTAIQAASLALDVCVHVIDPFCRLSAHPGWTLVSGDIVRWRSLSRLFRLPCFDLNEKMFRADSTSLESISSSNLTVTCTCRDPK
jgi:hypothetical protein